MRVLVALGFFVVVMLIGALCLRPTGYAEDRPPVSTDQPQLKSPPKNHLVPPLRGAGDDALTRELNQKARDCVDQAVGEAQQDIDDAKADKGKASRMVRALQEWKTQTILALLSPTDRLVPSAQRRADEEELRRKLFKLLRDCVDQAVEEAQQDIDDAKADKGKALRMLRELQEFQTQVINRIFY